jgi:hypothetical protein
MWIRGIVCLAHTCVSHDLENLEIYKLGRKVQPVIYGEIVMYPAISPPGTPKTTTALVSLDERESRSG